MDTPKTTNEYQRLPGRGVRKSGPISLARNYSTLWAGSDHLLCLDSTGYTEEYRRFYYDDIQAIIVSRTATRRRISWTLGALTAVASLAALLTPSPVAGIFWAVAGGFAFFWLLNWLRGPSCVCCLRTAVHVEHLPSLNRIRTARTAIDRLRLKIEQAQGVMSKDAIGAALGDLIRQYSATATRSEAPSAGERRIEGSPPDVPGYWGMNHGLMFGLLLANAAATLMDYRVNHLAVTFLTSVVFVFLAVATISAVVRQRGSTLSARIQTLTWVAIGYLGLDMVLASALLGVINVTQSQPAQNQWDYLRIVSELDPRDVPFLQVLLIYNFVVSFALGTLGSYWLWKEGTFGKTADRSRRRGNPPSTIRLE